MVPLYSIGSDAAGCRRSVFCAVIGVIAPMCKVRISHRGVQDWSERFGCLWAVRRRKFWARGVARRAGFGRHGRIAGASGIAGKTGVAATCLLRSAGVLPAIFVDTLLELHATQWLLRVKHSQRFEALYPNRVSNC